MSVEKQKKISKKKVLRLAIILVLVIAVVAIIVSMATRTSEVTDPELYKAQSYDLVESGDEKTQSDYVTFDAFFLQDVDGDGYAEGIRGSCNDVTKSAGLYMELKVMSDGYFENGKITIGGDNVKLSTSIVSDSIVDGNYISDNTTSINLKEINNGTQRTFMADVKGNIGNDTTKYSSSLNYIELTGTHVSSGGVQTTIDKKVYFTCDWYGDVKTSFYNTSQSKTTLSSVLDYDTGKINLSFTVYPQEELNELLLKGSYIYGTIPELNGYMPESVIISGTNVEYTYDEETGEYTAKREAVLNGSGVITTQAYYTTSTSGSTTYRRNSYTFDIVYPIESFTESGNTSISLNVPVYAYYEAYNNSDELLGGCPLVSSTKSTTYSLTWSNPGKTYSMQIGTYRSNVKEYVVSKKEAIRKYDDIDQETEDLYTVYWNVNVGTEVDQITLSEANSSSNTYVHDQFYSNSGYYSTDGIVTNKGVYFTGAKNTLGTDGKIYVYDADTDNLVVTFTDDGSGNTENWNSYTSSKPYYYSKGIDRVKIVTTEAVGASFYVYNIKEIDDEALVNTYSREIFDDFSEIYTYLHFETSTVSGGNTSTTSSYLSKYALYEEPLSRATISISPSTYGTQTTEEGAKITISTDTSYYNLEGWTNGEFLVEFPKDFLAVSINKMSISSSQVEILAYEVVDVDGQLFLEIVTENSKDTTYTITIDCDITPDPTETDKSTTLKLYSYNEYCDNYYNSTTDIYDVDGDGNVTDKCGYSTASIKIVSPATLLTSQIASDYDEEGSTATAPQIAVVDKSDPKGETVTITGTVTNNYGSTVSEVVILGQTPYKDNKFIINNTDLGSTYTTSMVGPVTIDGLDSKNYTIYYTDVENPTSDISDSDNNWILESDVNDWSKVRAYLIDLGDYVLANTEKFEFSYTVKVPSTVQYNEVSCATHAIYFCLDTEAGKYKTSTETNKLAISIERKFNLDLVKYKEDTLVPIQSARFSVTADGESESRIAVTDSNGHLSINDLNVEKLYTLKEIKTPSAYEVNDLEVKFMVSVSDDEQLVVTFYDETDNYLKSYDLTQPTDETRGLLSLEVENVPKYIVVLNKCDEVTGEPIKGVKYTISSENNGDATYTTSSNGQITISGLSEDTEYTLKEISATGYYVNTDEIVFSVSEKDGEYTYNDISNSFEGNEPEVTIGEGTSGTDAEDKVELTVTNTPIPTFSVELVKYELNSDTVLAGAQYRVTGDGISEKGETYTTDSDGVLTIPNLYLYEGVDGYECMYTIEEVTSPTGYTLNEGKINLRVSWDDYNKTLDYDVTDNDSSMIRILKDNDGNELGEDVEVTNIDVENKTATLQIGVVDKPLFELTKKDEDGNYLEGVKFVIYELNEDDLSIKDYAKDINGNYVGEFIESEVAIDISFSGTGTYPWTENSDGVWQSSNQGIQSSSSTMISNEFTLTNEETLTFDWTVSSESKSYDYLYYTITDVSNGTTIGGTSTKIGGTSYGTSYNSLEWIPVTVILDPGTYTIEFTYIKDSSTDKGTDTGYVRNINVGGEQMSSMYVSTTDEEGKISYGLQSGLYKVVEVETLDEYVLEVDEENRTNYFGIDANKEEEKEYGVAYNYGISSEGINKVISTESTSDGGVLAVGYFENEADVNGDGQIDLQALDSTDGFLVKYDEDGKLLFTVAITGKGETAITDVCESSSGIAVCGYFESNSLFIDGSDSGLIGTGSRDAMILLFDSNGSYQKGIVLSGSMQEEFDSIIRLSNGEYVVGGTFTSTELMTDNESLNITTTKGKKTGIVVCYSDSLGYEWSNSLVAEGEYSDVVALAVSQSTNDFVVLGNTFGTLTYGDGITSDTLSGSSSSYSYGFILKYDNAGDVQKSKMIGTGSYNYRVTDVISLLDGRYVVTGAHYAAFTIDDVSIGSGTSYAGMMLMLDSDLTCTYGNTLIGSSSNYPAMISTVSYNEDDEGEYILIGGYTYNTMYFDEDKTQSISISGVSDGYVAQYEIEDNSFVYTGWYRQITSSSDEEVTSISVLDNGEIVTGGWFSGSALDTDQTFDEENLELDNYEDGFIIKYGEVITSPLVAQLDAMEIENEYKRFDITVEIAENSDGERTGGTVTGITGSGYKGTIDTVRYGDDASSNIIITPNDAYIVTKVTLDGEEIAFVADEDGTVTLPGLENVTEEHHYVVTFEKNMSQVVVYHILVGDNGEIVYDENTSPILVADTETLTGKVGSEYSSAPKIGLDKYDIAKNSEVSSSLNYGSIGDDDDYYIPENATGTFENDTTIYVKYYYVEKQIPLTVYHFIEGTEENVPTASGEDPTEYYSGKEGEEYVTHELEDDALSDMYEVSTEYYPENSSGIYSGEGVNIYYYYKVVERDFELVKVDEDGEAIEGITFAILDEEGNEATFTTNAGGTISGSLSYGSYVICETETLDEFNLDDTYYTISIAKDGITLVSKESNGVSQDVGVLLETKKYEVEIHDGEEVVDTQEIDSGIYQLEIVNTYKLGKVIVHHYIYDESQDKPYTEEKVPSINGGVVEDITYEGRIGESYMTYISNEVSNGYNFVESKGDTSGKFIDGTIEVYYYYNVTQKFTITKINEYGEALEGVKFEIINNETGAVESHLTDENGQISTYLNFGEYTVKEVETIYGYELNEEEYSIKVDGDGVSLIK